jgi:hypothetical protein
MNQINPLNIKLLSFHIQDFNHYQAPNTYADYLIRLQAIIELFNQEEKLYFIKEFKSIINEPDLKLISIEHLYFIYQLFKQEINYYDNN